ncbi:MAG: hypothetical protein ACLQO7_07235, partial [Candidatus Bathyarchaeia archaeon]
SCQRLLRGFTSTSIGNRESFRLHFGHFPPFCVIISSGGFNSEPSYKTWLQPWQITRCGIPIPHLLQGHGLFIGCLTKNPVEIVEGLVLALQTFILRMDVL